MKLSLCFGVLEYSLILIVPKFVIMSNSGSSFFCLSISIAVFKLSLSSSVPFLPPPVEQLVHEVIERAEMIAAQIIDIFIVFIFMCFIRLFIILHAIL